jgi:hypothetical protein
MRITRIVILGVTVSALAPFAVFAQIPSAPASLPAQNLPCEAEIDALTAKFSGAPLAPSLREFDPR